MIAKIIVHAPTRAAAANKLARACAKVEVWPVRTNAAFLARAAADPDFVAARIDTGFIERHADRLIPAAEPSDAVLQAAAQALLPPAGDDPWTALRGFRANRDPAVEVAVAVAGATYLVTLGDAPAATVADGVLFLDGEAWAFGPPRVGGSAGGEASDGAVLAPMPGRVIAVAVAAGQGVARGERLVVLEAMKMEQALVAPFDGIVAELKASEGAQVAEGTLLVRIDRNI